MNITLLLFFLVVLIPSAILHEYMHGWVANYLGDPTAKHAGRLTLDPRAHIDKFGTIYLPLIFLAFGLMTGNFFIFAYAKPVPYNPYNLKNQKWGPAAVAAAGPLSNLFLAFVFGLIIQLMPAAMMTESFFQLLFIVVQANVLLAIFNLVPIPPLDGSKLLFAILPDSAVQLRVMLERYGFIILLFFIFYFFSC